MIKKVFCLATILAPGLALAADPSANFSVQVVPAGSSSNVPAGYNLDPALSDEFNGTSLDTTKFKTTTLGAHSTDSCMIYDNSNVYESGGYLHIKTSYDGTHFHQGPQIIHVATLPDNYYTEIRLNPATGGGLNVGVYSFGYSSAYGSYSQTVAEVDDIEYGSTNWYFWGLPQWSVINWNTGLASTPGGYNGNWHTVGRLRQNGIDYFYYDGVLKYTLTAPYPQFVNSPDQFEVYSGVETGCPNTSGLPTETLIDYIRVYHP